MDGFQNGNMLQKQKQVTELKVSQKQGVDLQKNLSAQATRQDSLSKDVWQEKKWLQSAQLPEEALGQQEKEDYRTEFDEKKMGFIEMPKARQEYDKKLQQAAAGSKQ